MNDLNQPQQYEAEVPATLDLAEMAELTIRGITNRIAPEKGCLMYTRDNFCADPPHMHFLWANEGACEGKHLEGLPLLLMNRASRWLDVDSYLPYQGRVVLKIKDAGRVAVRIPEWTDREQVACTVGGADHGYRWSGNYIVISKLKGGDTVDIRFPMRTETLFRVIGADTTYKLTVKGYTVIAIDPKGEICPLYCRDAYQGDTAPLKTVTRVVLNKAIHLVRSHP